MALTALNPNLLGTDSSGASKLSSAGGLVQLHSTGQFTIANTSANNISIANTGAITLTTNTFTVGTSLYSIANGNVGVGTASPAVSLDIGSKTDAVALPGGTTAQRPTVNAGGFRYNSNTACPEYYNGSAWISLGYQDGSTPQQAATSATALYNIGIRASGVYWLKPTTWTYPAQLYCEMTHGGGGWVYVMQRYLSGDQGLPYSWTSGASGVQNYASSSFYGTIDQNGNAKSVQDIWDAFVGSGNNGKVYARETFTNGSYDEYQYYVGATDNAIFSKTNFLKMFYGNFPTVYGGSSPVTGIKVYYNNGGSSTTGQYFGGWGSTGSLGVINNGSIDGASYFCNGEDGGDGNWMFALGKSGTPYPGSASYTAGSRTSITRYGVMAIKA